MPRDRRPPLAARDLSAASLRATLGMVTQDGQLFHDSVRANLVPARPTATDDELWAALARARLDDLVRELPDGLDTVVGERGYRLSGGERWGSPQTFVLGEHDHRPAAAGPPARRHPRRGDGPPGQHLGGGVQEALAEALADRRAVVIAHRLSTIRAADLILVVEPGQLQERGTHDELLALDGRYAELYRTRFAQRPGEQEGVTEAA